MLEANQLWLHHCLFIIYSDIASATTCNSTVQTCHDHDHGGYWVAVDATRAEPALTLLHANFQNITLTSLDLRKVLAYSPNLETPCTLKQNVFFWRLSDRNKLCYTCNIHVKSSPKWCFKPRTGWTQHHFQWTLPLTSSVFSALPSRHRSLRIETCERKRLTPWFFLALPSRHQTEFTHGNI